MKWFWRLREVNGVLRKRLPPWGFKTRHGAKETRKRKESPVLNVPVGRDDRCYSSTSQVWSDWNVTASGQGSLPDRYKIVKVRLILALSSNEVGSPPFMNIPCPRKFLKKSRKYGGYSCAVRSWRAHSPSGEVVCHDSLLTIGSTDGTRERRVGGRFSRARVCRAMRRGRGKREKSVAFACDCPKYGDDVSSRN